MIKVESFSKSYESSKIEAKWRKNWSEKDFYKAKKNPQKKPYTIVMPPPNITGDLTMGHMMYTLQDILIRWHRAQGFEACWIPGTDHASIATEAKVTKMLEEQGIAKKQIGREAFLQHALAWKEKYGHRIVEALQTLGISCDWSRNVFTMDENYSQAVIKAIVQLYRDGLVYQSQKLVNWCPVSQSVISDEEVNPTQINGKLWHIRYPLSAQQDSFITVATTRPETLFGDMAVAVHPDDEKYKHLIGKSVIIPICNRTIPIIADTYVDKDYGTGAVKITPAHDPNDFEVGKRHHLTLLNIMNPDASLNQEVPPSYQGLDRFVARKKLLQELSEQGFLEKEENHLINIGISERGHVPIEYYLSKQWYIKTEKLAALALDATRSKRLKLIPAHQEKVWEHWLTNIQEWCISRQLWWGHRLPMYECQSCHHMHCEEKAPLTCSQCGSSQLKQDEDVLDTWASSWLWSFAVHNWANPTQKTQEDLSYFYPTDVIITGADIIFFWIARMVMAGEYFTQKTPFKTAYFTPLVRDAQGKKMSKSLGNSPDLTKLFQTYGADALRFSLVDQIVTGQDIFWSDESCNLGKNFANKIWNVTRFLVLACEKQGFDPTAVYFEDLQTPSQDPILKWVVSAFFDTVEKAHSAIEKYEFSGYTHSLYEFTWMVFCDWFIELIKPSLSSEQNGKENLTVAFQMLDGILRLLHPVMPFLTEEIWHELHPGKDDITIGHLALPARSAKFIDTNVLTSMREVQDVVSAVRTIRGKFNIHPAKTLAVTLGGDAGRFGALITQMEFLAKAEFIFAQQKPEFCAAAKLGNTDLFVNLEGLVDKEAEIQRLTGKIEKIHATILSIEKRLGNTEFVRGAPAHILEGAKKQLQENTAELTLLQDSLNMLTGAGKK